MYRENKAGLKLHPCDIPKFDLYVNLRYPNFFLLLLLTNKTMCKHLHCPNNAYVLIERVPSLGPPLLAVLVYVCQFCCRTGVHPGSILPTTLISRSKKVEPEPASEAGTSLDHRDGVKGAGLLSQIP